MGYTHKEVIIYLCSDHYDLDFSVSYPDFSFNCLPSYHSSRCEVDGCLNDAFYKCIGLKVPEKCPNLSNKHPILAPDELYLEAVKALVGGPAIDKLTSYLYYKVRTYVYDYGDFSAVQIIKQLSKLVLKELNIDESSQMSARQVSLLLKYLRIYPIDFLEQHEKPEL